MAASLQAGIEERARVSPDAAALTWHDLTLSYGELNRRANRLAHRLRRLGVGPETFAGACLRRSPDLIVSLLAVLKAGGAYVPLDPAYPRERLGFLLRDTGALVLLTEEDLLPALPEVEARLLCPGSLQAELETESAEDPAPCTDPDHLAYGIPTSGSTGRPKCVAVRHGSAVALVRWAAGVFTREELAGALASTSVCFDLSVFEIFVPLSLGGRVILGDGPLELPRLAAASAVTLVNTVPSAMAEWVRSDGLPASVRVANLAGEPLRTDLVRRIYEQSGVRRVLNLYGPSEDTTYSTFTAVARGDDRPPAIGRPITGTSLHLLDPDLRPVPHGAEGEIFLGGAGLARGYLGRPDLTAERFVPDPFGEPGLRLYRTGDLGRLRADGEAEFLGRLDHQVKVRGFRIELGEVDAALAVIPGVEDCVTVAHEDGRGVKRLVAYVVAGLEAAPSPALLRSALGSRLPDYMVPSLFVFLEALPRTPNGKVDRKALPAPEPGQRDLWTAPRTATEEILAGIWSRVLGLDRVGADEDFLALGGDSISAHQVAFELRRTFGCDLGLRELLANPPLHRLAERLDELRGQPRADMPAPSRQPGEGPLPTSVTQHGLLLLDRFLGGSRAFHVPVALRLAGPLDSGALAGALDEIVRRHEALRTYMPLLDGQPVQRVEPFVPRAPAWVDLAALAPELRETEAARLVSEELRRPFHLETGPLLRRLLLRLTPDEHLLLLTVHHLVIDGWSINLLAEELSALYTALAAGEPARLPVPELQYADYAAWQRSRLTGPDLDRLITYWQRRLAPPLPLLDLPTDHPRPIVRTEHGGTVRRGLPVPLVEGLRRLAAERGTTFFLNLLGAFETLLRRWSGQEDLIVGTPILNRHHPGVERVVGFFVEMLPLRADLSGDPPFLDLLARTREGFLADLAHQDLPFELMVDAVRPARDLARPALFQTMLVLNPPLPRLDMPGLRAAWQFPETGFAKLEVSLEIYETDGRMEAFWELNRDLFDRPTIERMAAHLETLLGGILSAPGRRLSELPLLADGEQRQLLAWNRTGRDRCRDLCVHELFEAQADRIPWRLAAVCGGDTASYGELEERANRLAWYLRSLGVAAESRVGIGLDRSLDMIVALLAVLKAGGTYVPFDPAYPRERLLFMAEDAGVEVLVTQDALVAVWQGFPGQTVRIDAERERIAAFPATRPAGVIVPEALAYAIYTSGSTGRPKGVAIPHRAFVNFLESVRREPGLTEDDELVALTTLAFDIAGLEIFLPLTTGARVVVAPAGTGGDVDSLVPLLSRATVAQATPVTWKLLVDAGWRAEGRRILCGGEALTRELAEALLAGDAELWNLYGPTETTVWSSVVRVEPADGPVLLGGPIADTEMHGVDAAMFPLPAGIAGELVIGGAGLARGYLGRPDATAERFVPNPFGAPGSRLYRTGDLVRRRGDRLEFLGRIDHQVKVRGFRVELGEIEAALTRHPAVATAVVTARQDGDDGDVRLVAYVVPARGPLEPVIVSELRDFLGRLLPRHMIPAWFVPLDALPLTANGKVDRRALPAPDRERPSLETGYLAPRDAVEETLAEIWSKVLGVEPIGVRDNFFDLGGQSLQATYVTTEIRGRLGCDLALPMMLRAPTIESLAVLVREGTTPPRYNPLVCLQPAGGERPFFCVHGAGGQVLRYVPLARLLGTGRPFWALQARGFNPSEEPFATVEEMAEAYLAAIRKVQPAGPYLLGGYSLGGLVAYEMACRLEAAGERVAFAGLIDMGADEGAVMDAWDELQVLAFWTRLFGLPVSLEQLAALPAEGRIERLLEIGKSMQRLPPQFTAADAQRYLRVHQTTLWATRAYRPGRYGGKVTLFQGEQDPDSEHTLGWKKVAAGVEIIPVSGSHDTILSMPHLEVLAERLRRSLDAADPGEPDSAAAPSGEASPIAPPAPLPSPSNPARRPCAG